MVTGGPAPSTEAGVLASVLTDASRSVAMTSAGVSWSAVTLPEAGVLASPGWVYT